MKILVVEDNARHQKTAVEQLGDLHELTIVDNLYDARKALEKNDIEIVLSDLMLPFTKNESVGDEGLTKYPLGTELPFGFIIALFSALTSSVKYIAILTDRDHHADPISAGLDHTGKIWWGEKHQDFVKPPFFINEKRMLVTFAPMSYKDLNHPEKKWKEALDFLLS